LSWLTPRHHPSSKNGPEAISCLGGDPNKLTIVRVAAAAIKRRHRAAPIAAPVLEPYVG
jgi:hypothetical protein